MALPGCSLTGCGLFTRVSDQLFSAMFSRARNSVATQRAANRENDVRARPRSPENCGESLGQPGEMVPGQGLRWRASKLHKVDFPAPRALESIKELVARRAGLAFWKRARRYNTGFGGAQKACYSRVRSAIALHSYSC